MQNNVLSIWLWGQELGRIYWDKIQSRAVFEYNSVFISTGIDVAPLSASIHSVAASRPIVGNKDALYQGLPPFIADSLPDKWGSLVFECWAKENNIRSKDISPVDKLAFIGKRAMGALEFRPAVELAEVQEELALASLYDLAQRIFDERTDVMVLPEESLTLQSLYAVGTSAGGKHPKAIIAIHNDTHEIRSGQIDLGSDFTYYILKFAETDRFPYTQVEQAYYEMATAAGITMMPSRLVEVEGKKHFLTERFDRKAGKRIHIQTLAAMSTIADSYEDLMRVARLLEVPQGEQDELFMRMVFNVFGGNVDDHQKNFSFQMTERGEWHITPAYDMTFTTNPDASGYENSHCISVRGKVADIAEDDLLQFAAENSISRAKGMIDRVATVLSECWTYLKAQGIDDYWADKIEESLASLLPERFAARMTHHLPTPVPDYTTDDGHTVCEVQWRETRKHELQLCANVDEVHKRYVWDANSAIGREIMAAGWKHMPVDMTKKYVEKYLLGARITKNA